MELFDDDGLYPSEEALAYLRNIKDEGEALDYAKALWHYPEAATHNLRPAEAEIVHAEHDRKYLRLATMGWSGNESVIRALKDNRHYCWITWQMSARGGLHIFKYPKEQHG